MSLKILPAALALCLFSSCHRPEARQRVEAIEAGQPDPGAEDSPAPAAAPAQAKAAVVVDEKSDLLDFHFAWSAEANAVTELASRFGKEMAAEKARLLANAREEQAFRKKEGLDFNGLMSSTDYETSGQSPRLLSLTRSYSNYTGGAHGNHGSKALVWDRALKRELSLAALFASPAGVNALLVKPWCDALAKARIEKRGEATAPGDTFGDCPELNQISVVPMDRNGDGRFDQLALLADPYVAGPYAEGDYEIMLPVSASLIAALRPEYQPSFGAGQPQ